MRSSNDKPKSSLLFIIAKYVLVFIFVVYVLIWGLSPIAARYFAAEPLKELGISLADDTTIRYNPFTSTVSISELQLLDNDKNAVLSIDDAEVSIHLHRLLFKQLYVSEFLIDRTTLKIVKNEESLVVAGIDLFASKDQEEADVTSQPEGDSDLGFSIIVPELSLSNIVFDASVDGVLQELALVDLSLASVKLNQKEQAADISIQAKVNEAPLNLSAEVDMRSGQGSVISQFSLEQLDLHQISPLLTDLGIQVSGLFSASGNPNIQVSEELIALTSEKIQLSLSSLDLSYAPWVVEGASDVITIDSLDLSAQPNGIITHLSATVGTDLTKGNIGLESKDNSLVNWQNINLSTDIEMLDMQPKIAISEMTAEGLHLSEDLSLSEPSPILQLAQLKISDVQFGDNRLHVDRISIAGLETDIQVNPDKSIVSMVDTAALSAEVSEQGEAAPSSEQTPSEPIAPQDTGEQTEALGIVLNSLKLEGNALIHISDASVTPAFNQKIVIETLQAGPFDSTDALLKSPFELVAKDEEYLKIAAQGHLSPFAEKLNAEVGAKVSELNLPSVSPYVKDGLGFEMKSGQLDVNVDLVIKDDEIDGETNLFMRGIEMSSADEVEQGTIKEGKAMPLNIALGMLKDDQDNIELAVPMRGNVSEPSFGIESFLSLILKKAAMSQAQSYLMNTFVPYASVVSVALSGAEYLLKVRFEPLVFATGEQRLTEQHQQYLAELVLLMTDKPDLQLKTCAVVTYADLDVSADTQLNVDQQAQLKVLGDERQNLLKRYLIEQGITSSRILYCAPELDTDADAQPRIDLKTD